MLPVARSLGRDHERNAACFVVSARRRAAAHADDGVVGAGPWTGRGLWCWLGHRRAGGWLWCAERWGIAECWRVEWRRRTERRWCAEWRGRCGRDRITLRESIRRGREPERESGHRRPPVSDAGGPSVNAMRVRPDVRQRAVRAKVGSDTRRGSRLRDRNRSVGPRSRGSSRGPSDNSLVMRCSLSTPSRNGEASLSLCRALHRFPTDSAPTRCPHPQ